MDTEIFKIEFANYLMNNGDLQSVAEWYNNQTSIFPILPIELFCKFKSIEYDDEIMYKLAETVYNEIGYFNF